MSCDHYPNSKRSNEDHIFAWNHLVVIIIIGVLLFFPAISGGLREGVALWMKFLIGGTTIIYALRILMHSRRGFIQISYLRIAFHVVFWMTFLAFYVSAVISWDHQLFASILSGILGLFPIGALGLTLYFNFILGKKGPIEGWG